MKRPNRVIQLRPKLTREADATVAVTGPRPLAVYHYYPDAADYVDALLTEHGQWPVNSDDPITISCAVRIAAAALEEARRSA